MIRQLECTSFDLATGLTGRLLNETCRGVGYFKLLLIAEDSDSVSELFGEGLFGLMATLRDSLQEDDHVDRIGAEINITYWRMIGGKQTQCLPGKKEHGTLRIDSKASL